MTAPQNGGGLKRRDLLLTGILLLAVAACAPQPSPPATTAAPANQPVIPVSYAAGSSANTTRAYDGTYAGVAIQNVSKGGALTPGGGVSSANCPNYPVPPPLTISNGLAQLQALDLTFQGYVTPQGGLAMRSGVGQTFEGQIDNRNILGGRVLGRCAYDVSWQRSNRS